MNSIVIGIIGILCLFVLMAMRMQIGFAMALVGFVGFIALNGAESALAIVGMEPFSVSASFTLSVVPMFLLMAQFANHSNLGSDVYQMVYRMIGRLPGGLAIATIGACSLFAAISGSSLATAATFGMVSLPEMRKFKYSDQLSTGCIAAGGTLGILIPPSTVLIIYGILTETGIRELFIAGIIPGILLTLLFILTVLFQTIRNPEIGPRGEKFTSKEKIDSLKNTWSLVSLFIAVIGGLYFGIFTPTEAAGVGAFGAFLITLIKGRLTKKTLNAALKEAVHTTAMVFGILIGAKIFQFFLTLSQLPNELSVWVVDVGINKYMVVSLIILLFIIMGCFMEGLSIMILAVPIVFPIVIDSGFNEVWFGIIITLVMEMSLITPPVGVNVFILHGVAKDIPMSTMFKGIFPFWIAMFVCIIILIIWPGIVTFLPNLMMR